MNAKGTISPRQYEQQLQPLLLRAAGMALAILRNRDDAEDAVQEAALKGCRARESYDPAQPFKGWWLAILRNCCRDMLRQRMSAVPHVPLTEEAVAEAQTPPAETWEPLARAMERLSPPHRQILELRYFADCSYHEIAVALSIPEGTVMSRLHAARKALAAVYHLEEA